jgi:signal transduction histidine kinase
VQSVHLTWFTQLDTMEPHPDVLAALIRRKRRHVLSFPPTDLSSAREVAMTGAYVYAPDIWPPLAGAIFLAALGLYGWRRRSVPGALPFAIASLFGTLVLLAMVPEAAAVQPGTKIAWYKIQVIWQLPAATAMTCFVLEYAFPGRWLTRGNVTLLALPPLLLLILTIIDDGRLMWRGLEVAPDDAVVVHLTAVGVIMVTYAVGLILVNAAVLLRLFIHSPQHRWPVVLILFGMIASRGVLLLDITHSPWRIAVDPLVLTVLLPWTMYAIALFGFHILDPLPPARTVAIEQMQEGMVVLDARSRVASLNPAAVRMLSVSAVRARGKTLDELLPAFPDLCARLRDAESSSQGKTSYDAEISLGMEPDVRLCALECSVLEDFRGVSIGHLLMLRDVTEQRRVQAQTLEQQRTLAVLHERERLARELHDSLAQVLAFMNTQGQAVRRLLERGEIAAADEQVGRLVEVAREADIDIRESILGLRVALAEGGLWPALTTYLDQYEQRFGIHTELRRPETFGDEAFAPLVEVQLLRIIQEALANARKHSCAHSVRVTFAARDGFAQVAVQDDGCGFDPGEVFKDSAGRVGLRVMRERAEEIGGALALQSAPGRGTEVVVTVPLMGRWGG